MTLFDITDQGRDFFDKMQAEAFLGIYPLLRIDEMPLVSTHIVSSGEPPTGIGEVAVPVIGPAVANAVFAAIGKPVRKLHMTP